MMRLQDQTNDPNRSNRIYNTATRYINNIYRQQERSGLTAKIDRAYYNGDYQKANKLNSLSDTRRYARSTYMGLSAG